MLEPWSWLRRAAAALRIFALNRQGGPEFLTGADGIVRPTALGHRRYAAWVARYDILAPADRKAIRVDLAQRQPPLVSVLMPMTNPLSPLWRDAIRSVEEQLYPHWELCIALEAAIAPAAAEAVAAFARQEPKVKLATTSSSAGDHAAFCNAALAMADGAMVVVLAPEDQLAPHALYMLTAQLEGDPRLAIVYADEDRIDAAGCRHTPYFKPDWNAELFRSLNFLGRPCGMRRERLRAAGGFRGAGRASADHATAASLLAGDGAAVSHLPHVLYHRRAARDTSEMVDDLFPEAWSTGAPPPRRVPLAAAPRVSLIMPTRDKPELLRTAVEGLRMRTRYPNFEIIIIDNDSREQATLDYFATASRDPRIRVVRMEGAFNFSAFNNRAVRMATGEILAFINNDIDVITPHWLESMVAFAVAPRIGAVGAKLYYADDTIQHAGVTIGIWGAAGHDHRHYPRASYGYFGQLRFARQVSCVTGACLVLRRTVFDEIGGFDEANLKVTFNDVDLCLRIREAGYDIIWTPDAELYHVELASRGSDATPENRDRYTRELAYMKERWGATLHRDPFHNPNLSQRSEVPALAVPPRTHKPWR